MLLKISQKSFLQVRLYDLKRLLTSKRAVNKQTPNTAMINLLAGSILVRLSFPVDTFHVQVAAMLAGSRLGLQHPTLFLAGAHRSRAPAPKS